MNRRDFLTQFPLAIAGLRLTNLPTLQTSLYTYGAWLLPLTESCDPICLPDCLEFYFQIGTRAQRDAFFSGLTGATGRGYYGFSHPRLLEESEIMALKNLFEERCYTQLFPLIQK